MKFLHFGVQKKWGLQKYLIPYSEIKYMMADLSPGQFTICFLDKKISGFVDTAEKSLDVIIRAVENETCDYFLIEEYEEGEDASNP